MKTLHLTLKKEWYAMIESGEKFEEYREIKPYWDIRFFDNNGNLKRFDIVVFSYGYTKKRMAFRCSGIRIGRGRTDWGAPRFDKVFIISLGNRIY